MSNLLISFATEHEGIVVNTNLTKHDAQYDYYGKRLATAGSDGKINIFEVGEKCKKVAEITK
jgi:hypothetical protein